MQHDQQVREVFDFGYKSLGQVVYHFQELEAELARAVSFLIDPLDGDGADIVVCELSFKQLTHIGYSLFDLYNIPDKANHLEDWKRTLGLCLNAENQRNQILHSNYYACYSGGPENMEFIRYKKTAKFKRGSRLVDEEMGHETVKKYLEAIAGVAVQISKCMANAFPGWHERRWEPDSC